MIPVPDDQELAAHGERDHVEREIEDLGPRAALVYRDHVIGLESTIGRLRRDLLDAREAARREAEDEMNGLRAQVNDLRASRSWQIGRLMTAPARLLRKGAR